MIWILLIMSGACYTQDRITVDVNGWINYRLATGALQFDPGPNGAGLAIGMAYPVKGSISGKSSVEFGAAGTGNFMAFTVGLQNESRSPRNRLVGRTGAGVLQGIMLYRPAPLYVWGLDMTSMIGYELKNRSVPGMFAGIRYYGIPGYAKISEVNRFLDLRIGMIYLF